MNETQLHDYLQFRSEIRSPECQARLFRRRTEGDTGRSWFTWIR